MSKVFISHSSKDKRFVRTLKDDLNENSIETWFDEDQLDLGDSLIEKLEKALEESTHFLIILSQNSINSDWVKFELNKAIKQADNSIMSKVIPIKYKKCEIPNELSGLLYADLSDEVVQTNEHKVRFTTDGYSPFLTKLVKTIKTDKILTHLDKKKLREEIQENEKINLERRDLIATLALQVDGFGSVESKSEFINKIKNGSKRKIDEVKPILFPRILKNVFKKIEVGKEFTLYYEFANSYQIGHFAGFRRDDIKMTIDSKIRKELNIKRAGYYVRFDGNTYSISFTDEM